MRLSKQFQILLGAAVIALIAVGAYGFLFFKIKNENALAGTLRNSLSVAADERANLDSLKVLFATTTEERAELDTYLLKSDAVVTFIESIEQLHTVTGASLSVVAVGVEPDTIDKNKVSTSTESLRITIDATGTWNQLMHVLALIEALPYHVNLTEMGLRKLENTKKQTGYWQEEITFLVEKL